MEQNIAEAYGERRPKTPHTALKTIRMLAMLALIGLGTGTPAFAEPAQPKTPNPVEGTENNSGKDLIRLMIEKFKVIQEIERNRQKIREVPPECQNPFPGKKPCSRIDRRNLAVA